MKRYYLFCLIVLFLATVLLLAYRQYYTLPKIIWMYWDTEEIPDIVQKIQAYNANAFHGWDVRFLNRRTMFKYVAHHDLPPTYSKLLVQHKADWLRLYLLQHYGGCWIDASIIINDTTVMNRIRYASVKQRSALTGFQTKENRTFQHTSGTALPLVVDNWFIMAPPNSPIIRAWHTEFTKAVTMGLLNYKRALQAQGVNISAIHFKHADDVYLTQHMCIQKVLQRDFAVLPPMYFLLSSDSMFKIQIECKWKNDCIRQKILEPAAKTLPYIKLTKEIRESGIESYFTS